MRNDTLLLSKNGIATRLVAIKLLEYAPKDRIPTISELSETLHLARGTVQNAIFTLEENNAIRTRSRGILGSFLENYDIHKIMEIIGIDILLGTMPLPYTRAMEGLAYGMIQELESYFHIPTHFGYMAEPKTRIEMMLSGRYDFAIVSEFYAKKYMSEHDDIAIVMTLGANSYTSKNVLLFAEEGHTEIEDGMTLGVPRISLDQVFLLNQLAEGKKVNYYSLDYYNIVSDVENHKFDATVLNYDDVSRMFTNPHFVEVDVENFSDRNAAVVVNKRYEGMAKNIIRYLSQENIRELQERVIRGEIYPHY